MIRILLISIFPFFVDSTAHAFKIPLFRYNKDATKTHYFTANISEQGNGKNGYVLEGVACYINKRKTLNTVAFFRYTNVNADDYVYTASFDKDVIESKDTYHLQERVGYIYTSQVNRTVPLYKYYSSSLKRHFYTISYQEIGKRDLYYELEGIAGYVFIP